MTDEKQFSMDRVAEQLLVTSNDWRAFNQRIKEYGLWLQKKGAQAEILRKIDASADPKRAILDAIGDIAQHILSFAGESEVRQRNFANLASLGSPEAWRLIAEANHLPIPTQQDPALNIATDMVRKNVNLPQLIFEIAALIEKTQGGQNDEEKST